MLEVLSTPTGQVGFSTVDGIQPYLHKYPTPVTEIKYCDTVFNTPHRGIPTTWRTLDDNNNVSTSYVGRVPHIKFYSGRSIPPTIINYNEGDGWQVSYAGYFIAPIEATYTFYYAGDGQLSANLGIGGGDASDSFRLNIDSANFKSQSVNLSAGQNELVVLTYTANRDNTDAGFICMWQTDSASYTPEKVVLSGDLLRPVSETSLPSFEDVGSYSNITYKENEEYSELSFEVPFVSTSNYNYAGYRYKATTDSFVDISSEQELKEYRMIRYREGFRNSIGEDEFVTKFTGQIRDFDIRYNSDGKDSLRVICYDYSVFTKDSINLMSPTPIDYWQAEYTEEFPGRYNGFIKPRCFDGWDVHKAYQVILTECGVSPFSFINKKSFGDYDDNQIDGGFLIESLSLYESDTASIPYFMASNNYGIPPIGEVDVRADDEYIYPISTGEYYKDALDEFMRPWYYKWGFAPDGSPYLKRINAPYNFINDRELDTSGSWTNEINVNALKGTYIKTSDANQYASCEATGKKFALLCGCGPNCGSSDPSESTYNVVVRHGSTVLVDTNYNAYDSVERFYFDGANQSNGVNPCIFKVANGLDYDTYKIVIKSLGTYESRIEGVMCYDEEYEVPLETYYTSDKTGNATITELGIKKDIEDHRTDCVVLGRRTGTIFKTTEEGEEITINRNNPVHTYIQSASRDLRSVYNHTAHNYIGRPRTTLVIDPSIVSQEQADYISFSVVDAYNEPLKQISFSMVGNPMIQVDDCIAVVEDYKQGVSSDDYLWVTEVENTFDDNGYQTRINTTPIPPVDSFWGRPAIDVENEYDGHYIWNLTVKNSGYVGWLANTFGASDSGEGANIEIVKHLTSTTLSKSIPKSGYARLGTEIIKYDSADISGANIRLNNITRRIQDVDSAYMLGHYDDTYIVNGTSPWEGTSVIIAHNPYSEDSWPPVVEFDLLAHASIRVNIKNYNKDFVNNRINNISEFVVDSLTKVEEDPTEGDNYRDLKPGHYRFAWGGLDRIGAYNNSVKSEDEASMFGSDFYARENFSCVDYQELPRQQSSGNYRLEPTYEEYEFSTAYGQFYGDISVIVQGKKLPKKYVTDSKESYIYDHTTYSADRSGVIKQILCDPGIVDLKFATSGLYYASPRSDAVDHEEGIDYFYYKGSEDGGIFNTNNLYQATNYPYVHINSYLHYPTSVPVVSINGANQNSYGVPQGLKFKINRIDSNVDASIQRQYLPTIKFRYIQIGGYCIGYPRGRYFFFEPKIHEGVLNEDSDIQIINTDQEYYFNLNKWTAINDIEYLPTKWVSSFIDSRTHDEYVPSISKLFLSNYLIFSHDLIDMSGRKPKQARYYKVLADPDTNINIDQAIANILSRITQSDGFTALSIGSPEVYEELKNLNSHPYDFVNRDNDNSSNRGFYQFFRPKHNDNWNFTGDLTYNFHFLKNIRGEIRGNPSYEFKRDNYIVWMNEDYVRRVRFYPSNTMSRRAFDETQTENPWDSDSHVHRTFWNYYASNYPDIYVPNLFFEWRHEDF